jgi:GNAT superfamily N-acetyltransferase
MTWEVAVADKGDLPGAIAVWRAANEARGIPPAAERVSRVGVKLREVDALVLVARDSFGAHAGMALAEPGRSDDGTGPVIPGLGHISMVFVVPGQWGRGIGARLLGGVHDRAAQKAWAKLSLWTRETNVLARHLYESRGYTATGRVQHLPGGDRIIQYKTTLAVQQPSQAVRSPA